MRIEFIHKKVVRKINNLSILSSNEDFLKRLLTFRSYDKVQSALKEKGIDISLGNIDKIKKIVYDLEKNKNIMAEKDLTTIKEAGNNLDVTGYFNKDLYDFFYSGKNKYPADFFLNKDYYNGETISSGLFTIACIIFNAKEKYLKTRALWEIPAGFAQ